MSGAFNKQHWKKRYRHFHTKLAICIAAQAGRGSLTDFGAGLGLYAEAIERMGATTFAYDGTPGVSDATDGKVKEVDLSIVQKLPQTDYGMSIEVLEHIPFEEMNNYLKNIENVVQKKLFISVATPGQRGSGHVNCMSPEEIISVLVKRGTWELDQYATDESRKSVPKPFDKKFLVFKRKK